MKKTLRLIPIIAIIAFLISALAVAGCSTNPESPPGPGTASRQLVINLPDKQYQSVVDQHGKLQSKLEASSADGRISILMGKGTSILDGAKKPPPSLNITVDSSTPPPPENTSIIGSAYNINPEGITFNPGLFLTLSYDPEELAPEINEKNLYTGCYDGTSWEQPRYRKLDTEDHTVTTQIHTSATCAILGSDKPAPTSRPAPATGIDIGKLAPDFELQYLDGQTFSLSSAQGKPVLLNFWATWCGPCRSEMPLLQQIYEEYSSQGLVFVAVDIGENAAQVEKFMQNNSLTIPVLLDTRAKVATTYNVSGIPTTLFIDKDGIIRNKKIGALTDKSEIEQGLNRIGLQKGE